jgi:hypothetical protein
MKPNPNYRFRAVTMLLLILQEKNVALTTKIYKHTKFQDLALYGVTLVPASQVRMVDMMVGN